MRSAVGGNAQVSNSAVRKEEIGERHVSNTMEHVLDNTKHTLTYNDAMQSKRDAPNTKKHVYNTRNTNENI